MCLSSMPPGCMQALGRLGQRKSSGESQAASPWLKPELSLAWAQWAQAAHLQGIMIWSDDLGTGYAD